MKQARQVIIPDDRILTMDEYKELFNHAKNSSIWYLSRYARNSAQIKEKLYNKGYIKDSVYVITNGDTQEINIVDKVIEYLIEMVFIDDKNYAKTMLVSQLKKGKGLTLVKNTLIYEKKVDPELLNEIIEEIGEIKTITQEQINKIGLKLMNSSTFKKKDKYGKKQFLYQRLSARGFNSTDIINWIDNNFEEDNEW